MKRLIKPVGLVVLTGLLILFGAKALLTQETKPIRPTRPPRTQDTTKTPEPVQKETYVSEVILSAPWAKKNLVYSGEESPPGEFGYHVPKEESPSVGPSTFAVAPNGDIYVADQLNNRMQRFNSEGDFITTIPMPRTIADICIDRDNNIYLYGSGCCVLKYDQDGSLLVTYPIFTGTGNFIYCDKFGRVFVASPGVGPYQIGTSTQAFSLEQQKNSVIDGFLGINSAALDKNLFFRARPVFKRPDNLYYTPTVYYAVNFDGDTVHIYGVRPGYRFRPGITGSFFGCDEDLNIYLTYSDYKTNIIYIRKYDPSGNLISTFKYICEEPYSTVSGFGNRAMTLDEKGNLYMLCCSEKDGIKVIKWYKETQKGGDK